MTRKFNNNEKESTQFGLWLREQQPIDSSIGFTAYNIDYVWRNYKKGTFMFLEEKRYNSNLVLSKNIHSADTFLILDDFMQHLPDKYKIFYKGFHLIQFEKTNPDDGYTKLDRKIISNEDFIKFLRFELEDKFYISYFLK